MFAPRYTITHTVLSNVKRIAELVQTLNGRHFPRVVLAEFERRAKEISAHASTSIEGNPLPLTEVRRILKHRPEHIRISEREVINYNKALTTLNAEIVDGPTGLTLAQILKIQKIVTQGLLVPSRCGKLRSEPVFVSDPRTRQTVYWPPDHGDVGRLMKELLEYAHRNRNNIDPLLLAGVFHKQFVIIHPFMDGNGRTARLATKFLLAGIGLNTFNLFSFENYYNQNVGNYFKHVGVLGNYYEIKDSIDFTPWLEYFTDGIIDELLRVGKELEIATVSPQTTLAAHHNTILDYIRQHGFITDRQYAKLTDRARPTRNLDFRKLIALKLISKYGKGRATYYK